MSARIPALDMPVLYPYHTGMHLIEIDNQIFEELSRRATGFHVSPNDVLRKILKLPGSEARQPNGMREPPGIEANAPTLLELIRSSRFQQYHQTVDRFLAILEWLHARDPEGFGRVALNFHRGIRRYFGKSQQEIEESGGGITAKPIPASPFWVLTTLDNKSKRIVIEDLLNGLNYSRSDIEVVKMELPDSNIRRRRKPTSK